MKLIKDGVVVETTPFLKNIWTREGFVEYEEPEHEEIGYQDLKKLAKEKGINSHGLKKDELLEALKEYL